MRRGRGTGLAATLVLVAGAVAMLAAPGAAVAKKKTRSKLFSSGVINQPIPNNAPVGTFAPIGVGKRGKVKDVNVAVRISHNNVSQLHLYLFKGEKYVALARGPSGGGNTNFGSGGADCSGTFTVFDGAAPTFLQTAVAPYNGAYRPLESLALFNGDGSRGTWRLHVYDNAGGAAGTINCWALGLKYETKKKGKRKRKRR